MNDGLGQKKVAELVMLVRAQLEVRVQPILTHTSRAKRMRVDSQANNMRIILDRWQNNLAGKLSDTEVKKHCINFLRAQAPKPSNKSRKR